MGSFNSDFKDSKLAKPVFEAFDTRNNQITVMANDDGWITTPFMKAQLDGKTIFFPLPPSGEKYFGHLHVEQRADGRLKIDIDYGGPDSAGQIQSGRWTADQNFADQLRQLDFIVT